MTKNGLQTTLIALVLSALLYACKHEPILDITGDLGGGGPDTTSVTGIPCDPDSVYFQNEILPLLASSCAQPGCHDQATAEDGVILNNYSNIINTGDVEAFDPESSDIYDVIIDPDPDNQMPPPGESPLTDEQIQLIYTWIAQGALNNGCASCDTNEVTFAGTVYPIIELKCQGCHSGDEPSAGLALLNHFDVSSIALSGQLMNSLAGTNGETQMPFNAAALPTCEIDIIDLWIADGAPDN